jgi:biopolymer transport protein ExbD
MPLIDVIFLLLTFFIYAMVLMVRAELLPVEMHPFASGEPATLPPAIAITIDRNGTLFFNREQIAMATVLDRLKAVKATDPETVIYIAAEATGTLDRLPTFLNLYDQLAHGAQHQAGRSSETRAVMAWNSGLHPACFSCSNPRTFTHRRKSRRTTPSSSASTNPPNPR